jgi:hypothetical protein
VFDSNFVEGHHPKDNHSEAMSVQTLQGHEPFEILHPILYYLYSDRLCSTIGPINETSPRRQVPPFDAQEAYRVGDILGLPELKKQALGFLVNITNGDNILARIFEEFALRYDEVGQGYERVFYKHWKDIRCSGRLTKYFKTIHEELSEERIKEVTMRCVGLLERTPIDS